MGSAAVTGLLVVLGLVYLASRAGSTVNLPAKPAIVFDEIYDGEHLRDLLFSAMSGLAVRHSVLVLFDLGCSRRVEEWRVLHDKYLLPDDFYVQFAVHDYDEARDHTWYSWDPDHDLTAWFGVPQGSCKTFFIPRGSTDQTPPVEMDNSMDFLDWVWDQVKVNVTLINAAEETVVFRFHGRHMEVSDVVLSPGEISTVEAYTSYLLSAEGDMGFYGGWTLGYKERNHTVVMATMETNADQFFSEQYKMMDKRRIEMHKDVWDYADRHLLNRKQPLLLQNFTTKGYLKLQMPPWIKNRLVEFYEENKEFREPEFWTPGMTAINMENHRCGFVQLNNATRIVVASGIRPLLEEWCSCNLTMAAFYGIREYYKGHRLKKHVDRINTHIISVILQIAQDLDGGPDWELEVINFDGHWEHIKLKAGEMLFYESARLIHGRPEIFQGKVMANAFLHFFPEDWLFERRPDGHIYYDGESLLKVYPLHDPRTFSAVRERQNLHSGINQVIKDEL